MIRFSFPLKALVELTLQYFHDMLLDVLAEIRQFGLYAFFLTCSADEFHWTEIIHVVTCQYGQTQLMNK